jgi:hypothetical protein
VRRCSIVLVGLLHLAVPTMAGAQAPPNATGRLLVTVIDQSRAVIPGATVTVAAQDAPGRATAIAPVQTSPQGLATIRGLAPGRYTITAAFSGFETGVLKDVRVGAGDSRHVIVLAIERLQDSLTVGQDPQVAATDRRGTLFGNALTREQIDALSDDPEEMKRQLQDMAGPNAIIRVDSFEGGSLPLKSQIKSIHITRDAFAAENHGAGGLFVDVITQPGVGKIRFGTNWRFRDGALSGRSPFTPEKGPEQIRNFGFNTGGSLIPQRSSFSLGVNGMRSHDTSNLNAALPGATISRALPITSPRNNLFVNALFDYALTRDQTLRVTFNRTAFTNENLGIGAYDLAERAFSTEDRNHTIRIQEAGPLGRRYFTNTRLQLGWSSRESYSALEAPTIRVNDAFTGGGQQIDGGTRTRTFNLASDLDYVRGIHSLRFGIVLDGGWHRSDERTNYLGTYTFESLEAFEAGRPRSYTRRLGDPGVTYFNLQTSLYAQDDVRVSRALTLHPGLRYEAQTHLEGLANLGPRFGFTWAPFRSGRTSFRGSAGIFYDWMTFGTYEQTLRVDGFRQQELNIIDPSYPVAPETGLVPAINRYLLADDLTFQRSRRLSAGIDHTFNRQVRINTTYAYVRGAGTWRGRNLNQPVNGVRPDPGFGNIVQVTGDGRSRQHSATTSLTVSLARATGPGGGPVIMGRDSPAPPLPPGFGGAAGRRWDWTRVNLNGFYTIGRFDNNTDGAFSLPATGNLEDDWGPSPQDVRHRLVASIFSQQLRNLGVGINLNFSSGTPYTIRTGGDENGDFVFSDRPAGVGRNTARTDGQWSLNFNANYTIAFGQGTGSAPPGVGIFIPAPGAAPQVLTMPPQPARYRIGFNVNAQNLTNRSNYGGYSGTLTSPFFGLPTMVLNPRKVDFGINFNF